jgi:hypothetical protein
MLAFAAWVALGLQAETTSRAQIAPVASSINSQRSNGSEASGHHDSSADAGTRMTARFAPTIWHVDQSAMPGGDGQSWATTFRHPQDALDVATAGDDIWVAAGAYLPTHRTEPANERTVTFQLISGVGLYGAFPPGGGDGTFEARADAPNR